MRLSIKILSQHWKTIDEAWRFAILTFLAVRLFYALWSLAILTLQPLAVQNIELSNEPILTIFNLQNSQTYTYLREINGKVLNFRATSASTVSDLQTRQHVGYLYGSSFAGTISRNCTFAIKNRAS